MDPPTTFTLRLCRLRQLEGDEGEGLGEGLGRSVDRKAGFCDLALLPPRQWTGLDRLTARRKGREKRKRKTR